jgi:glycine oxidase
MTKPVLVVGAGLAGCTLAWQLHFRGLTPRLLDRGDPHAASRVAAGLITPVTGKRMAISWKFDTVWPVAVDFYRRMERELGTPLLHVRPAVRLFQSADERAAFDSRRTMLGPLVCDIDPSLDESFPSPHGGFAMPDAAVLDVATYLRLTRERFGCVEADCDPGRDEAETVVFCHGYSPTPDPQFPWVTFNPTKGDILSLDIPGLREERTVHRGGWLARMADGSYRAGATHVRDDFTPGPSAMGRVVVEAIVRGITDRPFTVIGHGGAVRPIVRESRPVLGIHPLNPRFAYFNGLGSKGSLLAPYYAGQLAVAILGRGEIDADVDVAKAPGAPGGTTT